MNIDVGRSLLIIAVCAVCTFAERALPFAVFRDKEVPSAIRYLGKALPMAVMTTLVVYCLRNVSFLSVGDYLPEVISLAFASGLYLWRKNSFLSILVGTACYMILIQRVFI